MKHPILLDLYPGAKRRALTFTFDDGVAQDRRFIEILNQHALRATFHLVSSSLDKPKNVRADEVKSLYANHEVAGHTIHHPHLTRLTPTDILNEVLQDRKNLESLVGGLVRGFAYPYGTFDDRVVSILESSGLTYARTTQILPSFDFPISNFLRLGFTCRHSDANPTLDRFLTPLKHRSCQAMIVMGHTYEFDHPAVGWDDITTFCKRASAQEDIWYTTLIELVDYTIAQHRLQISADGTYAHNPSAITLWATVENQPVQLPPGQTIRLS